MTTVERRTFLKAAAGGAVLAGPFSGLVASEALAAPNSAAHRALRAVPDLRDGVVRLWLPEGFSYRSFHDTEKAAPTDPPAVVLDDGTILPGRHDGMGAFRGRKGSVVLVRNHEVNSPGPAFGPTTPYDAMAQGGTTTVAVTGTGRVLHAHTSLSGTMMNCSGGIMPWGSWVTCEETVNGPDVGPDFTGTSNVPLTKPHGYVFEVPSHGVADPAPITRAGRFPHEAVSFDPRHGVLYLTEDNFAFPSGFYRYIPWRNPMHTGRLGNRGRLQMLKVRGTWNADLASAQPRGATYGVRWVDIDDPAPEFPYTPGEPATTTNDQALTYVGNQGRAQGAAHFSRLEGQVYDDGVVYFTSTQGGGTPEPGPSDPVQGYGNGYGQVWAYDTRSERLRLVYESPGPDVLDFPDNITTSKHGTLVLCEDSTGDNYLRGLTTRGRLSDIALNRLTSLAGVPRHGDEFAGSTFSPDGRTLFVNIQASAGLTFAIWGPWRRIGV
jgi:secreted PhoX family phosphatase